MKKSICIILTALLLMAVGGAAMGEETEMATDLITPERLLELAGLTESDIDMQDLQDAIVQFGITEEMMAGRSPEEIAQAVQYCMNNLAKYDYSSLFSGENLAPAGSIPVSSDILRMAAWRDNDVLQPTWVIDFEKGRCYYDNINFLKNVREARLAFDLTEEFSAAVRAIVEAGDWADWEVTYVGDLTASEINWQLAIETPEGIILYTIMGFGAEAPDGLYDVNHNILELFWEKDQ